MKNWVRWVLLFHILFFAGFTLQEEWLRRDAHTIYLETIPVDPRDLWSGQYMTLRYQIENDPLLKNPSEKMGILLTPTKEIQTSAGLRSVYTLADVRPAKDVSEGTAGNSVWVIGDVGNGSIHLGINRFYFNEKRVEEMGELRPDEFLVEISVSAKGVMRVKDLIITRKPSAN